MNFIKKLMDYLQKTLMTFSLLVLVFTVLNLFMKPSAGEISILFEYCSKALSLKVICQLLLLSALFNLLAFLMNSSFLIKKISRIFRLIILFILIYVLLILMIKAFRWFPENQSLPWIYTSAAFVLSFVTTVTIDSIKEKKENEEMNEALKNKKISAEN